MIAVRHVYGYDQLVVSGLSGRSLLLNTTYEPLKVVSWQRAVTLLCLGKVEVVRSYAHRKIRAASWSVEMPSVIKLRRYIKRRRIRVALSRQNIFYRDDHQCQYCQRSLPARELTCDHVNPRTQGGRTSWENITTACGPCNRRKGGRTPEQARMRLRSEPGRPSVLPIEYTLNLGTNHQSLPEGWSDYLGWTTQVDAAAS